MNLLLENIPVIGLVGFTLAVFSNVILIWGRKEGTSIKVILKSGHLNRKERAKIFSPASIRLANLFGYMGVGLFLFAVLLVVVMIFLAD